jgi:electron transport complex protein RnfB
MKARVWVPCSTKDAGKAVMVVCKVGCIGCKMCVKVCPADAVTYEDNLVKIDHKACIDYGPSCEEICVTKCPRDIFLPYEGRTTVARAVETGLKMAG